MSTEAIRLQHVWTVSRSERKGLMAEGGERGAEAGEVGSRATAGERGLSEAKGTGQLVVVKR